MTLVKWYLDEGAWGAAVHGVAKSQTRLSDFTFTFHFSLSCIGEGNGNPLQCSCLENPRDGGAGWAAVSGVAQSWIWLKWLSSSSSSRSMYAHGGEHERNPVKERNVQYPPLLVLLMVCYLRYIFLQRAEGYYSCRFQYINLKWEL